jgi:hypothetical protein
MDEELVRWQVVHPVEVVDSGTSDMRLSVSWSVIMEYMVACSARPQLDGVDPAQSFTESSLATPKDMYHQQHRPSRSADLETLTRDTVIS